ncbi:ComEC/Rec2 family competence protein [Alteribacter populi]|uniref:ComEC/Rec2 family competence protein n=1 Tax=Alteribacter populi TaxID=2011011 RepID=UPI000BBB0FF9|nr:MBL fold metallo-hydrolase [Alteribacter populi]
MTRLLTRKTLPLLILATLLASLFSVVSYAEEEVDVEMNLHPNDLAYTFFDINHGESTFIQNGNGENTLVDTGHRISKQELAERLEMYHVSRIDTVIITNKQAEYTGNLLWLLTEYNVDNIYIPKPMYEELQPLLAKTELDVIVYETNDEFTVMKGLECEVLFVDTRPGIHEGASVLTFEHEDQKLLYMSIADEQMETYITDELSVDSTVLKVAEFASPRGTSQKLLDEVDPQVAVIFQNGEETPSATVLERLQDTWIEIYQTARIGTVSIKWSEKDYEIFTIRPPEKDNYENIAQRIKTLFSSEVD